MDAGPRLRAGWRLANRPGMQARAWVSIDACPHLPAGIRLANRPGMQAGSGRGAPPT